MSVIFIVADGTGFSHYSVLFQHNMARNIFKQFKHTVLVNTSPVQKKTKRSPCVPVKDLSPVTESAQSASAMATGREVPRGHISTSKSGRKIKTITERARETNKEMVFGIVCTTDFYDATPAAFFAHSDNRDNYDSIASQILDFGLKVLISGGTYLSKKLHTNKHDLPKHVNVIRETEFVHTDNTSVRSVATHLKSALATLKDDPFFLLVEESLIDVASHGKEKDKMACELTSLMYTVQAALKYVENPDHKTTLIVISDHSTGGGVVDNVQNDSSSRFRFTSGVHNGHIVPMFLAGHRCDEVVTRLDSALIDMVDVHCILMMLLGVHDASCRCKRI